MAEVIAPWDLPQNGSTEMETPPKPSSIFRILGFLVIIPAWTFFLPLLLLSFIFELMYLSKLRTWQEATGDTKGLAQTRRNTILNWVIIGLCLLAVPIGILLDVL